MDKSRKNQQEEQFISPYLKIPPRSLEEVLRERNTALEEVRPRGQQPDTKVA